MSNALGTMSSNHPLPPPPETLPSSLLFCALLVLDATAASTLGLLDALLVGLDLAAGHGAHEAAASLEGALEVAGSGLAEQVDLDQVALEGALERDDALDEERVGVLEVEVHDAHHADAHQLGLVQLLELGHVVGVDRRGDGLGLLTAARRRRLHVLEDCHVCKVRNNCQPAAPIRALCPSLRPRTLLLVDLRFHVEVDAEYDQVGHDVCEAHEVQDVRVIKRDALRHLHHHPVKHIKSERRMWPERVTETRTR